MPKARIPIRRQLMTVLLIASGAVMLTTSVAFCAYDVLTYRQQTRQNLTTLGKVVAANSTAALAFDNTDDAREVLAALKAEHHIVSAALYTRTGALFAAYTPNTASVPPSAAPEDGYRFAHGYLIGVQPVVQGARRMGSLYIQSDLAALYERMRSFGLIAGLVLAMSCAVAYILSTRLQRQISRPILGLAETVGTISREGDYSARAQVADSHELALLSNAFNTMLDRVESAQGRLQRQLGRLDLLHRITRGIGERQDLASICQVVLRNLEDEMPIDFGCLCLYDAAVNETTLSVAAIGAKSLSYAESLGLRTNGEVAIDPNGLTRCITGQLVYEPNTATIPFPFPRRFSQAGLQSLVLAPLLVEQQVFGVLVAARRVGEGFSSGDCEFLRQLSEHVGLASNQAQLTGALQRAYDDLRHSQNALMQQERLRALGQRASGIAHDINNAISPISLYSESLLERERTLSDRARDYLTTIQRAIGDVAETVSRMREFYRPRQPELQLAQVGLNSMIQQVVELTRARWSDLLLQKGVVVKLSMDLAPRLAEVMGTEAEIRDALTNLIFNAVDAMPEGGRLTLRTGTTGATGYSNSESASRVFVEVSDTGIGMDDETRRRCLEPFYTTKGERGTGLGLAMVYGMAQRHSAEIDIESAVGKGTTVRLSFLPASTSLLSDETQTTARQILSRLRLLLVDDDPLLIKSLCEVLEGDGHQVTVADGGQGGIEAFLSARGTPQAFDVVITDLGMPYVDGSKVAAAVKSASPGTPVIMLTGWGRRLIAEQEVPAHINRLLSKPPKLAELRVALLEVTAGTATGTSSGTT